MRLHGGHRRLGLAADLLNAIEIHRSYDPIRNATGIPIAVSERYAETKMPSEGALGAGFCDEA